MSKHTIKKLQKKMEEIVKDNMPIVKKTISAQEAQEVFADRQDVLNNINILEFESVDIYCCGDFCDYVADELLESTGMVGNFELLSYSPGIILRMAAWQTGEIEESFEFSKRIFNAHQSYKRWLVLTRMYNLAYLNKAIQNGSIKNQVLLDETKAEQQISE